MTRGELENRLATFRNQNAWEKIEIFEPDPNNFRVALTLKPNIPISERLILRLEDAIGGRLKSLLLLRLPANVTVLRFTVRRNVTRDETEAGRVEETASLSYAKAGMRTRSTVSLDAAPNGADRV
jgi:hypothetical protein